jgi:hypothetical protein
LKPAAGVRAGGEVGVSAQMGDGLGDLFESRDLAAQACDPASCIVAVQHALGNRFVHGFHDPLQLALGVVGLLAGDGFSQFADGAANVGPHDAIAFGALQVLTVALHG